ncbi:MAG: alpha/beta fold hydrolase [Acidimicrobiales bacterium]|nr:alpha/beta fold hydrolase [Acidimicrobiales bacterium]
MLSVFKRVLAVGIVAIASAACATSGGSSGQLPIGTLTQAVTAGLTSPDSPPPGANVSGCTLTSSHPYPVILVHATFANEADNWQAISPTLANAGYCVYTFNYGQTVSNIFLGLGDIATSAQVLADEVNTVLQATGASQVDLVGHSQGGMMPNYYIKFLGGASKVHTFIGIAPSNHGTTVDGLTNLGTQLGILYGINSVFSDLSLPALVEQEQGSTFETNLFASGDTVAGPSYVVIETNNDEVVTPYTNAFLNGPNVTNITIQNQCPSDNVGHIGMAYDNVVIQDVLNALGPNSSSFQPTCDGYGISV